MIKTMVMMAVAAVFSVVWNFKDIMKPTSTANALEGAKHDELKIEFRCDRIGA